MENAVVPASILQGQDSWISTQMLNTREKSEMQVDSNNQVYQSKQNLIICSIQRLQADVPHGFYPQRWWLRQDQQQVACKPQQVNLSNMVQVQRLNNIAVDMAYQFHQRSGEIENFEMQKKKDANYLETPCTPAETQEPANVNSVRCIDGRIVRPRQHEEKSPSTTCNSRTISSSTPGGVRLGAAEPPCFGPPPGIVQDPSNHWECCRIQHRVQRSTCDSGRP